MKLAVNGGLQVLSRLQLSRSEHHWRESRTRQNHPSHPPLSHHLLEALMVPSRKLLYR